MKNSITVKEIAFMVLNLPTKTTDKPNIYIYIYINSGIYTCVIHMNKFIHITYMNLLVFKVVGINY